MHTCLVVLTRLEHVLLETAVQLEGVSAGSFLTSSHFVVFLTFTQLVIQSLGSHIVDVHGLQLGALLIEASLIYGPRRMHVVHLLVAEPIVVFLLSLILVEVRLSHFSMLAVVGQLRVVDSSFTGYHVYCGHHGSSTLHGRDRSVATRSVAARRCRRRLRDCEGSGREAILRTITRKNTLSALLSLGHDSDAIGRLRRRFMRVRRYKWQRSRLLLDLVKVLRHRVCEIHALLDAARQRVTALAHGIFGSLREHFRYDRLAGAKLTRHATERPLLGQLTVVTTVMFGSRHTTLHGLHAQQRRYVGFFGDFYDGISHVARGLPLL